jgi:hypothetical protein
MFRLEEQLDKSTLQELSSSPVLVPEWSYESEDRKGRMCPVGISPPFMLITKVFPEM